jgi:DNA-binding MarR family transcriptional regulator
MVAGGTPSRCEVLAQKLFEAITQFCLAVPRPRRREGDLKEIEFLTLSILRSHEPLIVGEIQRQLGILPAQMSRIIRSLEARDKPLIACRINPYDKRKIDVGLTEEGLNAWQEYQGDRVSAIAQMLQHMTEGDIENLTRLLDRFRDMVETRLNEEVRMAYVERRTPQGP